MPRDSDKKQKPIWKKIRKPIPPPGKAQGTKKGDKGYRRKKKGWQEEDLTERGGLVDRTSRELRLIVAIKSIITYLDLSGM